MIDFLHPIFAMCRFCVVIDERAARDVFVGRHVACLGSEFRRVRPSDRRLGAPPLLRLSTSQQQSRRGQFWFGFCFL